MGLNRNLGNIPQVITELDGKIGVGATSPNTLLEVASTTSNAARIRVNNTSTTAGQYRGYEFANGTTFKGGFLQDQNTDLISIFTPIGGQSVNINSSGNVGIGTASIGYKCQIENSGADVFLTKNTSSTSFNRSFFYNNNNTGIQIASFGTAYPFGTEFGVGQGGVTLLSNTNSAFALGTNTNTPLYLGTNGTTRINVTSGGNVLLSSGSDNGYRLQVNGSISSTSLSLSGNFNATVPTNSGWTSYQTLISPGTLTPYKTYMISIWWHFGAGSNQPYYYTCSFLWSGCSTNGNGTDNEFTPIGATHTGGTGASMSFRSIGAAQSTTGIQARLNGFATTGGDIYVRATIMQGF